LNVYNFTGGDQVLHLAQSHGIIMRGHNLASLSVYARSADIHDGYQAWNSELPDFLATATDSTFTKEQLV
jgi:GH35 family endo-1,4-beta-xylanase